MIEFTEDLTAREQYWLDYFAASNPRHGYNLAPEARSSRGRTMTTRERTSRRRTTWAGCADWLNTPEAKAKRAETRRRELTLGQRLTWEQACSIRDDYGTPTPHGKGRKQRRTGGITLKALAEKHGVGVLTVYDVVHWITWRSPPQ